MKTFKRFSILAVILSVGFAVGLVATSRLDWTPQSHAQTAADLAKGRELAGQLSEVFESASKKLSPSVVPIFSEAEVQVASPFGSGDPFGQLFGDDFMRRFFGTPQGGQKRTVRGLGSGVIVSSDGYILTNNHVVHGADKLTVIVGDEKKYPAKVIGTDPQTDVALIKIDAKDLQAANLGNSDDVRVGQWVIAVGNPFQLLHTVTAGIISATGRSSVGLATYEDFMQTDASINPGNSGGALADLDGNVIGINTAISSPSGGSVGIGFAIPINMAKSVMEDLKSKGQVTRGYLAVIPQDIDDDLAKALKLKDTEGALIGDVSPDGPADKAGMKRGDVITEFDGQKVKNSDDLRKMVAREDPKKKVAVTVLRDGREKTLNVVLGERPQQIGEQNPQQQAPEEQNTSKLGLTVQELTPELARQLGYQNDQGVLIADVDSGSPAEDAGLRRGDLIKEVDRTPVTSIGEFKKALSGLRSGDTTALLIRRGQATVYVAITMP